MGLLDRFKRKQAEPGGSGEVSGAPDPDARRPKEAPGEAPGTSAAPAAGADEGSLADPPAGTVDPPLGPPPATA
jgi:hypothetical protein